MSESKAVNGSAETTQRGERIRMTNVVRRHLETLETARRPQGRRTVERTQRRLEHLDEAIPLTTDVIARLNMVQERLAIRRGLAMRITEEQQGALEDELVKIGGAYTEWKSLTRAAWLEVGVPTDVLDRAGIK